ncbi:MAG TPA: glycoside hydrolase family 97 N-terminal domain-containing protein [Pirellulales bacterium]|nr:glycoside hydrolase family 97 N-terminal domain-containing protein [Pirellulales bacterium]
MAVAAALIANACPTAGWADPLLQLASPDDAVHFQILQDAGHLIYTATFHNQPVIERSALVMTIDNVKLTDDVELVQSKPYEVNDTYPYRGVHSQAVNHCRGATLSLRHQPSNTPFTLEARAYNDGIAFRFIVPTDKQDARVPDEDSVFMLPGGCTVWHHALEGHYEATYQKHDVDELTSGEWLAPPVTCQLPGGAGYAVVTEAALSNYPGMALQADGHRGLHVVLGHSIPFPIPTSCAITKRISRGCKPRPPCVETLPRRGGPSSSATI